jgi:hypothetical protein
MRSAVSSFDNFDRANGVYELVRTWRTRLKDIFDSVRTSVTELQRHRL